MAEKTQEKEKPSGKSRISPGGIGLLLTIFLGLAFGASIAGIAASGPLREETTVAVSHGDSVHVIANRLAANNIIYSAVLFRIAAKLGARDQLQAGEYRFTPGQSIVDIIGMMHAGHSILHSFTVAEGLTSEEVYRLMKDTPGLSGEVKVPAEGSLMPETYRYTFGDSRANLVQRMQKGMQQMLDEEWAKRDPAVPLKSPQEAVILASVVEKETGKPDERPRIASVFYNRLKINMPLQSDPTVIYALVKAKGMMDHDLDHHDLEFPSPYNTYMSGGLPPGPICNPGRASLVAVLHPEATDYLYFVADGTGGHVFAKDLNAHNRNITASNKAERANAKKMP